MRNRSMLVQLTSVPIDKPCDAAWDEMTGDDRVRRCASCERDVYDLSAMSPREAEVRLLNAGSTAPCIRYVRRSDGTIAHRPEPVPATVPTRSFAQAAALGVTLTAATLHAEPKKQPDQCVAYAQQPTPQPASAPSAPPASAPTAAAAPAPAPPVPEPQPLGGAPLPIQEPAAFGTVSFKSKVPRGITLIGISLEAPLASYKLTPGEFVADVREAGGTTRTVRFFVKKGKTTVVDLDAATKKTKR